MSSYLRTKFFLARSRLDERFNFLEWGTAMLCPYGVRVFYTSENPYLCPKLLLTTKD